MTTVIWAPEGSNDQLLTAVTIKPGLVTEADWLNALADRVQAMVLADPEPERAMHLAVRALNQAGAVTLPDSPARVAGQTLVQHNLALLQAMAMCNPEFPQTATDNVAESERLDDLENWLELAAMALHPS